MLIRRAIAGVGMCLIAAAMSGCGVRGSLQAPPQAEAGGSATSAEGGDTAENSAAKPKPHRGFVLDGLLR